MNNMKDFIIKEDTLERYYGTDKEVTVPEGISYVGRDAFLCCSSVTTVEFPNSLKEIGQGVFFGCKNLSDVTIPEGVETIGKDAFISCSNLQNVEISDTVSNIGPGAFDFCSRLKEVTIPCNIKVIEKQLFNGCSSLKTVNAPCNVSEIGPWAFRGCNNLTFFQMPESVKEIGEKAFEGCENLMFLKVPDGILKIGDKAFDNCHIEIGPAARQWSHDIFKQISESILSSLYAPKVSLMTLPVGKLRDAAVKGFLLAKLMEKDFDPSLEPAYYDYIRDHTHVRNWLYDTVENEDKDNCQWFVQLLVDNKLVPLDEFNEFFDMILRKGDPTLTAMVMNYKEMAFSNEEVDDFEDSLFDL